MSGTAGSAGVAGVPAGSIEKSTGASGVPAQPGSFVAADQAAAERLPPLGNTGVPTPSHEGRSFGVGVGWARGTAHGDPVYAIVGLSLILDAEVRRGTQGLRFYRSVTWVGAGGSCVAWEPSSASNKADEYMVEVVQGDWDRLGWEKGRQLLGLLLGWGVRLSRVDVYCDDYSRVRDPADLVGLIEAGQWCGAMRSWSVTRSVGPSGEGYTLYLGARSSVAMVRIYRKWVESGDTRDGVRWELEAKKELAASVGHELMSECVEGLRDVARILWAEAGRLCDWRDVAEGERRERASTSAWFVGLRDGAERAGPLPSRLPTTVPARLGWLQRAVAPTLALGYLAAGRSFLPDLVADGLPRLSPVDVGLAAEWAGVAREERERWLEIRSQVSSRSVTACSFEVR